MKMKLKIADYTAHFVPNKGKDNPLAEAINAVLQNNRQEIIESLLPHLEKAMSKKILELSNKISKHFSYDELFPDRE